MNTPNLLHIFTSLVQINWQALWLSGFIIAVVALLQLCRVLPDGTYSRWRLGLLLTATLTPVFLCLWTWISGFFQTSLYEVPYLWQKLFPDVQPLNTFSISNAIKQFVIWSYCAWLVFYPAVIWIKTSPVRRLLKRHYDNNPYWADGVEQSWQNEAWDALLRLFSMWRRVRIIEIEEQSPMTVGFFRPVIVVPDGINETVIGLEEPERFRAVLAHELAHVRYHSLWTLIHRFVVWIFPLPQIPVWLFNRLRKRFIRLQMDTVQASNFIGVHTAAQFEIVNQPWAAWRPFHALALLIQHIPDPATLMDVEFELHADFVAVHRGGADHAVLRETLLRAALWEVQANELAYAIGGIKTHDDRDQILDKIRQSDGQFVALEDRLNDLPADKGISLWAKVWKTAASLTVVHPIAIAIIPALVFLAETGSELTRPPAPGFAATGVVQSASAPVASTPAASKLAKVATASSRTVPPQQPPATVSRVVSNSTRTVASVPSSQNSGAREIPSPPRTSTPATQPQSVNTSAQDAYQRVAVLNEQQRTLQDNLSRQQQTTASLQRQQDNFNRNQQMLDSMNRNQKQAQTQARVSQVQDSFARANQQMQQTSMRVDQAQRVQNSQQQQLNTLQNAIRVNGQTEQVLRQQNTFNNSRIAMTPYIPPVSVTQPRIYTPPMNTYTPPRTYSPPPTFMPPPVPYIPTPPPRIR